MKIMNFNSLSRCAMMKSSKRYGTGNSSKASCLILLGIRSILIMQGKDDHILKLPVTLMRGGTSKGVYLLEEDLPEGS